MQAIDEFNKIMREFSLEEHDIYLLDLIPLIEMMWADGLNQAAELQLLYKFTIEHVAELSRLSEGEEVVSVKDVNDFLDRFAHQRPDPGLLKALRNIVIELHTQRSDRESTTRRQQTLLNYCLDIAAACVTAYPFPNNERVMACEKKLFMELMSAFKIQPDRMIDICD